MIAAPLHHRGDVIGTLVFYSRGRRTFGADDVRAASAVANLAAAAIGTASVYQKQAQLAETRRLLAEASDVLASSLDYETTLANVAALVVPQLADWCVVDVVGEDGAIQRLAVAHEDPGEGRACSGADREAADGPGRAAGRAGGDPNTATRGTAGYRGRAARGSASATGPRCSRSCASSGSAAAMIVPLVARRRALGAITFVASESGRAYDQEDLAIALDLARRAASAVDNAVLYREALLKESQVRFLAEAGRVLSEELDYDATLEALARLAVPRIADWCIVDVVDGAEIRRVAVAAADDVRQRALEELREKYPPTWDSPQPAARALREGAPVIFEEFVGDRLDDTVVDDEHLEIMAILDPHSAVAMPLVARGEKVGAITFAWSQTRRHYSERDLPLMDDLATRAALAVDNARLYARERATGDQLAFLAEMSSVLAASLDYETTLANVAQLIVPQFADWCAVDIVKEDGTIDRLTVVHRDPAKSEWARRSRDFHPPDPEEPEGSARVVRTRRAGALSPDHGRLSRGTARGPENLEVLRRARHGLGDGRADEGARAHARRADARLVRSGAALRRRRPHLRRAPRAPRRDCGRQRGDLRPLGAARTCGARARLRRGRRSCSSTRTGSCRSGTPLPR